MYSIFKILMKLFDLIDRIEENHNLRACTIFDFLVKMLKDSSNYILVNLFFRLADSVIMLYAFQYTFFINLFVNIEFQHIFAVLVIELYKLFFTSSSTANNIWSSSISNFDYLSQILFLLLKYFVGLIDCYEFTIFKLKVTSLSSINERIWRGYDNISKVMHFFVHTPYLKV